MFRALVPEAEQNNTAMGMTTPKSQLAEIFVIRKYNACFTCSSFEYVFIVRLWHLLGNRDNIMPKVS